MGDVQPTTPPRPHLRLRFTLRLLLAFLTLLCLALGWWTHRAREQRRIVERIEKSGGRVAYDFHRANARKQPMSPTLLRLTNAVGRDYFHNVVSVTTYDSSVLAGVSRFPLESLMVYSEAANDADMEHVGRIRGLEALVVWVESELPDRPWMPPQPATTQIGDRSLAIVARLPRLRSAVLSGTRFTDSGLESLARSRSLQEVTVSCCDGDLHESVEEEFRRPGTVKQLYVNHWKSTNPYATEIVVAKFP